MSTTTKERIKQAVASTVPAKEPFTIYTEATGIDDTNVLRVITPAWKKLPKSDRILRVQQAVMAVLDPAEQARVFRFSVLTPDEWKEMKPYLAGQSSRLVGRRLARVES